MHSFLFAGLLLLVPSVHARTVVHAEGRATSKVGEHVARKLAKSRAFASARTLCSKYDLFGEPRVIAGSGYDTAQATGNNWSAHYFADFECTEDGTGAIGPDYGPWPNQDETLSFQVLPQRLSWWLGEKECAKVGMRLPTWSELSANWRYLVGTTPVNYRVSEISGCASVCPVSIWTSEEKDIKLAYDFSNSSPEKKDLRGAPKEWRFAVVCVTEKE